MRTFIPLTILCLLLYPVLSYADTTSNVEIGVRGGTDVSEHNLEENYQATEIYFLKQLPWGTTLGKQTTLTSRFDIGAIYLEGGGDESGLLAVGADLVLGLWDGCIELEIGFRPTWMLDQKYGGDDFGGGLQFTSHVGATIYWQSMALNYRLQHTSNAGIYDHNPGLNMHLFGMGYRF